MKLWKALRLRGLGTMRTKLILSYALGIVLPLMLLGTLFIGFAGNIVENQLIGMAGTSTSQTAQRLNVLFQSYSTLADQYTLDMLFMHGLRREYASVMDSYDFYTDLWQRQRSSLQAWPYIRNITLYTENATLASTVPFLIRTDSGLLSPEDYARMQQAGYKGLWSGVRPVDKRYEYWNPKNAQVSGGGLSTFAYSRSLRTESSVLSAYGMITVEVHDDAILNILSSGMKGMQSILTDSRGNSVSGSALPASLQSNANGNDANPARVQSGGKSYLVWNTGLDNGWRLVSAVSLDVVSEQARRMRAVALVALAALAALALAAIWAMSSMLTNRARLLVEKMRSVGGGTTLLKPIGGNDEISVLDRAFTAMTARLVESMARQYSAEVRRTEAELDLLHTQINPHFLYNTLSAIAWLADSRPSQEVRSAIEKLASYYRITLAKGREIIPLGEELDGLAAYVELQRLRYGGRIRCLIEIDEALRNVPIPRLTLQPLVENSFIHGAGEDLRPISVIITASVHGEMLMLTVQDDGVGMDEERLGRLERGEVESGESSGLGYRNVAERIRLHFGGEYGLKVSSELGYGTTVEILLPLSSR